MSWFFSFAFFCAEAMSFSHGDADGLLYEQQRDRGEQSNPFHVSPPVRRSQTAPGKSLFRRRGTDR